MPEYQEKARIRLNESLGAGLHRLTISAPGIAGSAHPGQFVMVRCGRGWDPLLNRPFSVHQVNGQEVVLLYRVVGRGTSLLASRRAGESLEVLGPFGRGFDCSSVSSCLVGGGIGIAPLAFLARRLLRRLPAGGRLEVLLGGRNREELEVLAEPFTAMGCALALATDDGSLGHHGLVTDLLQAHLDGCALVQACGPYPMLRAVAAQCREAGVGCEVALESVMACGLGACLGCAVYGADGGFLHVCRQGPVLPADAVRWEEGRSHG